MFYNDRQDRFPEEFRINFSSWDYKSILDAFNKEPEKDNSVDVNILTDVILRIWRISNKSESYNSHNNTRRIEHMILENDEFDESESDYIIKTIKDSSKPIRFAGNQSKSILNVFKENGFEIKDHTNSKYYDGMAVKVLVFETNDDIKESIITETIKPSVYYNDELILNGEVIVTTPTNNDE